MEGTVISKTNYRPKRVRVRGKGQLTIPSEYREKIGIKEDTVMEVYQLGKVIVATPEKLAVKELAQSVSEGMTEYKISLEDLLADLREGKHEYIKEE